MTAMNITMQSLLARHDTLTSAEARDYNAWRNAKIEAIATYTADYLKPGLDARHMAESLMDGAEETGRIYGDDVNGELASRYTINGRPLSFTI